MISIKIQFSKLIKWLKKKLIEFFLLENSIANLSNKIKLHYVLSVGFDEIYNQIKCPKRFKICIIFCIIIWLVTVWHLLLIISPDLWPLIDNPFLPDHFKTCLFILILLLLLCAIEKTDFLYGEIKCIQIFELFHILAVHFKAKHQLTDKNYNRLATSSRIVITILVDYGAVTAAVLLNVIMLIIAILSYQNCGQFYFLIHLLIMGGAYNQLFITLTITGSIVFIYFYYFKLRFDQLNEKVKSIISNGNSINKRKEKLFLELINEHNELSLKIEKVNFVFKRTAAAFFVCLSLIKISSIYIAIYVKHTFVKYYSINGFVIVFLFGFGMSILFSLQINSAKKSYKTIHKVICNYKMRLQFKFKVN